MHKICFTISLFHASTCFEHHVLIVRRSKLYYTASGIIIPIGGCPVRTGCASIWLIIKIKKKMCNISCVQKQTSSKTHDFNNKPFKYDERIKNCVCYQHETSFSIASKALNLLSLLFIIIIIIIIIIIFILFIQSRYMGP